MKTSLLVSLLGLSALSDAWRPKRDYDNADYYVLHTDTSIDPQDVASRLGLKYEGPLRGFNDHHVFHGDKSDDDVVRIELKARRRRKRDVGGHDILDGVYLAKKQEARMRHEKRTIPPSPAGLKSRSIANKPTPQALEMQANIIRELEIKDPTFDAQWHLYNTVQQGHDVNVTEVWRMGITGKNATVAIIDDGLDMYSNDLKDNYYKEGSWDFNDHDAEPKPELSDDKHGTRCAGEIGAGKNDFCGLGVAYDSRIAGIRILSGAISDADEAEAMIYDLQNNQIYSCSWGPPDDGRAMEAPDVLIKRAMLKGVQQGRGGLGSIYVFASGNGASNGDNCNFDGYTNSIYSITVGAVDRAGNHPYYSEHCSAQLVVTYSSGSGDAIVSLFLPLPLGSLGKIKEFTYTDHFPSILLMLAKMPVMTVMEALQPLLHSLRESSLLSCKSDLISPGAICNTLPCRLPPKSKIRKPTGPRLTQVTTSVTPLAMAKSIHTVLSSWLQIGRMLSLRPGTFLPGCMLGTAFRRDRPDLQRPLK